ncbi:helix-turn-helix domain-containing protein [Paenibacillus sp. MER 99-2]|uniref:helix-turn-helix domain-containing protein n=1 Tax=Paenibacillus sp. MER 99-2 TaxID=2939572 RepID=UPI0020423AC9|nr:helix-turn-helix domain-containing protein [Paenibacillus sp. MER 99-2]MCM3174840.1 helix-turn-helix domain-containing protein [Paenibacillus sp. MER 99-2]
MLPNKQLQWILHLIYDSTRIPVFYIADGSERLHSFTSVQPSMSNQTNSSRELVGHLLSIPLHQKIQLVYMNKQADTLILMPISSKEGQGRLILWPNSQRFMDNNMIDQQLDTADSHQVDHRQLISAAILAHYLMHNEALNLEQVIEDNQSVVNNKTENVLDLSLLEQRENNLYHKSYLAERKFFEQVRLGNKKKMLLYLKQFTEMNGVYGRLSKNDSLRSKKNLIISAIAIGTRAAIDGGLYSEVALTLSDTYIQQIEGVTQIDSIHPLLEDILVDFTERVEKVHRAHFSKDILLCQEYIFNHLYDDLDLDVLANHLQISPSYLSRKFKEETGEALKIFIQKQRIEEAKNLIVFSDYQLSEIYPLLNFYDQSYFIKVFRKHTGLTPKQYRNRFVVKPSQ